MPEYDIELSRRFAQVAQKTVEQGLNDQQSHRVSAYLSRLSIELSLKSFLETANCPIAHIRNHSHKLKELLAEIDLYDVQVEMAPGQKYSLAASRLRSVAVHASGYPVTMGVVIEAQDHGASEYPSAFRYGGQPSDFPAETLVSAALALVDWVSVHAASAKRSSRIRK